MKAINQYDPTTTNWEKLKVGLDKYLWLMQQLHKTDCSTDKNFQKRFNGFYRIRQRSTEFYETLYEYLERNKDQQSLTFADTLKCFYNKLSRIEASFSSKLLATVNPNQPIWDSEVLQSLSLKKPGYYLKPDKRIFKTVQLYQKIEDWYNQELNSPLGQSMIQTFDEHNPSIDITPIKKIDLVLWQTRK